MRGKEMKSDKNFTGTNRRMKNLHAVKKETKDMHKKHSYFKRQN